MLSNFALFAFGASEGLISTAGVGHAIVINRCSFPIFLKSCVNDNPLPQILRPNDMYRESYRTNPGGGGVAIKVASNQTIATAMSLADAFDHSTITHFEYTYKPNVAVWYDISNIDGGNPWPFGKYGLFLSSSNPGCQNVTCFAGQVCTAAYILPSDNYAIHGCEIEQDLQLQLCSVGDFFEQTTVHPRPSCSCA